MGDADKERIEIAYGGDVWNSEDEARCSVGKDSGWNGGIICGFTCE